MGLFFTRLRLRYTYGFLKTRPDLSDLAPRSFLGSPVAGQLRYRDGQEGQEGPPPPRFSVLSAALRIRPLMPLIPLTCTCYNHAQHVTDILQNGQGPLPVLSRADNDGHSNRNDGRSRPGHVPRGIPSTLPSVPANDPSKDLRRGHSEHDRGVVSHSVFEATGWNRSSRCGYWHRRRPLPVC